MKLTQIALAIAALLAVQSFALGQRRGGITPGSAAPGLDVENWHNGEATAIEGGKVYVVLFCDLTNPDTRQMFSRMADLEERYAGRGMQVVAIASNSDSAVSQFTSRLEEGIDFPIGSDRRDSSRRAWVQAADLEELPVAFIVDRESKIQFIGVPLVSRFLSVLSLVVDDRFDAVLMQEAERYLGPAENARKVRNFRQCFLHLDKVIEMDPRVFARQMLTKFEIMLLDMKDPDQAYEYAQELITKYANDATFMSLLAEFIATDPRIPEDQRNMDMALMAAETAFEGYPENEPRGYATVALVHYLRGELLEAVEFQEKAWLIARPGQKEDHWRALVAYKDAARREGLISRR